VQDVATAAVMGLVHALGQRGQLARIDRDHRDVAFECE
jgi:hypothetical protein